MSTNLVPTLTPHAARHLALVATGTPSPAVHSATQRLAAAIAQIGTDVGWSLTVWGTSPSPLGWPRHHYHDLTAQHVEANHPLRALFQTKSNPIDVLYLPSLNSLSLVGVVDPIPAAVVVGIPELDIPTDPARAERFKMHVQKLFAVASLVIVASAEVRDQVLAHFTLAPERVSIVAPPSTLRSEIAVALDYLACFAQVTTQPYLTRPRTRNKPMVSRAERVLYLLNHTTLKAAEVPVIRSLGLEIYASKLISGQSSFRSGSVDYADNDDSTLPRWVLDELDRHNFYDDTMTPQLAKLVNDHFDVVICTALNNLIEQLMQHFDGHIVVRAFGREAPLTYAHVFTSGRLNFWEAVWRKQDRFWLGAGYDSIIPHEPAMLQQNAVMLPLTMPDTFYAEAGKWVGTDPRVYFICPDIHSPGDYYGKIYRDFKENFGHLPHVIGGRQVIPVDDPNVIGFVTDERMKQYFRELRVMYYHSREPRHLHYHPLEAIVYGMPLIYMNGGLLEHFARRPDLPGACDTYAEANAKLQRILAGDEAFTRSVIEAQVVILEGFAPEFVRQTWRERFVGKILSRPLIPDVIPFGQWQPPAQIESHALSDLPLTPSRRILFYGRMSTGDAAHHTALAWIGQVLDQTASAGWQIDLQWGASAFDGAAPVWSIPQPERLTITALDDQVIAVEAAATSVSVDMLLPATIDPNNPPLPQSFPLPERRSPPYLTLDDLYQMVEQYAVVCFPQPHGLLSPNLDISTFTPLPIVVYLSDLAHEYGDTANEIDSPPALSRECAIWSRLAQILVFPSNSVRNDAVKRYGIPLERTRVVPLPDFAPPSNAPINPLLPERYLLAAIDDPAQDNLDTILESLTILRQRGEAIPPLLLVGASARTTLLNDQADGAYEHWLQRIIRDGQFAIGKDIFLLLEPNAVPDLATLCSRAQLCLSMSRTGHDRFGLIVAALRAKAPLIVGDTPFTQHLGSVALLEPADDPVVLSDAILRIINQPDETTTRAENGAAWIDQRQQSQLPQIAQMLEQVAASRTQLIHRPIAPLQRKIMMASPSSTPPTRPSSAVSVAPAPRPNQWLVRLNTFVVHSVLPIFKLTSMKRYQRLEQDLLRLRTDNEVLTAEVMTLRSKAGAKSTSSSDVQADLKSLVQRVEQLEAQLTKTADPLPSFTTAKLNPSAEVTVSLSDVKLEDGAILKNDAFYTSLEAAFRGSDAVITQRQQQYLPYLHTKQATEQQPILDMGCGRGEFLRLLRQAGVPCVGVDPNAAHVEQLQKQGFAAYQQGGAEYLATQPAASLSAIVSFQVIEHVELAYLEHLLQLAMNTLVDDGQILLETVNPYCLATYRTFYIDPTHTRPLPVDLLAMLLWAAGFTDLQVFYQNPVLVEKNVTTGLEANAYETYALLGKRPAR